MKAQLETINYKNSQSSFHFFKREERYYNSFRHFHPELELTYIEQGTGIRYIGDNITSYQADDLVLIGRNLPHDYVSLSKNPNEQSIAYVFQFPASIVKNIPEGQSLDLLFSDAKYGIHFRQPSAALVEKIKMVSTAPLLKNFIYFLEVLDALSQHEERDSISTISFSKSTKGSAQEDKISLVTEHISTHFHQSITIEHMAKLSNMTPTSFCRWFKQLSGQSFITYLNATRIERACQLLIQSKAPISYISLQTGFETVSHFNRTFKKFKNITPGIYRKNSSAYFGNP